MNVLILILLPLLGAALPPLTIRFGRNICTWSAMAVTACTLVLTVTPLMQAFQGNPASMHRSWLDGAGLALTLRMDGLAALTGQEGRNRKGHAILSFQR
ncbi:hypothetical protein NLA06_12435 [Desulfomicrobium sp. ZS1]|uniref:hypothetical protein n=1 Tax=Desulfomicrobium sp. ZS1 TaxID=2952228 RepID=UPI0020B1EBFC|nr:hypothetical protein [Desulfomicrobium sp. ZS1]UTF49364.1 hypothetical protein NLA06_12435 [Desulfomicrobium sp. ZS1]